MGLTEILTASLIEQRLEESGLKVGGVQLQTYEELAELGEAHTRVVYGLAGYRRKEAKLRFKYYQVCY